MCADYRFAWEGRILIGKRSSTCNIFGCPKTHSDIPHRDLASTSKRKYAFASCNTSCQEASRGFRELRLAVSRAGCTVWHSEVHSCSYCIVHQGITILREKLVHEAILFPTRPELEQVMVDFEALCGLPCCGGALDGTFMSITKPSDFGDTYYCYKHFTAIIFCVFLACFPPFSGNLCTQLSLSSSCCLSSYCLLCDLLTAVKFLRMVAIDSSSVSSSSHRVLLDCPPNVNKLSPYIRGPLDSCFPPSCRHRSLSFARLFMS